MRWAKGLFGAALVLFALYGIKRFVAPPPAPPPKIVTKLIVGNQFEVEVVRLTNLERTRRGLQPLKVNSKMMADAHQWSVIQSNSRMHHSKMGYGENVAWNQKSPSEVVQVWMNSRGHRANILNGRYTEIGAGYARGARGPMWTQVFR
jgi:uncharacterized protein YkwD